MCNVTHLLLVMGMRLAFRKCGMSLTRCWSLQDTVFYKIYSVTYLLLIIGKYM